MQRPSIMEFANDPFDIMEEDLRVSVLCWRSRRSILQHDDFSRTHRYGSRRTLRATPSPRGPTNTSWWCSPQQPPVTSCCFDRGPLSTEIFRPSSFQNLPWQIRHCEKPRVEKRQCTDSKSWRLLTTLMTAAYRLQIQADLWAHRWDRGAFQLLGLCFSVCILGVKWK